MDTLLGFVVLAVIVGVVLMRVRQNSRTAAPTPSVDDTGGLSLRGEIERAVVRDYGAPAESKPELRRIPAKSSSEYEPGRPVGVAAQAWSPRTRQVEVAGEWYQAANLRALFSRHDQIRDTGSEIRLPAVLVPDADNPFDKSAVAVFVDELHVGYMERADAKVYHRVIASLPGGQLRVPSRQWLRATPGDTWARVTLAIPGPDGLICPNPPGQDFVAIPVGSTIQVTREENHMEHLGGLLGKFGSDTVLAASLRLVQERRPRSVVDLVAVDIDGKQVGVLTTTQTTNLRPLVQRAGECGKTIIARATLRGNVLKADVALHLVKAHELNDAQLIELFATP